MFANKEKNGAFSEPGRVSRKRLFLASLNCSYIRAHELHICTEPAQRRGWAGALPAAAQVG